MKIEVEINEQELEAHVRKLVAIGTRGYLLNEYERPTVRGRDIIEMAQRKVLALIESGVVQDLVDKVVREELSKTVGDLTRKTIRSMVRAELRAMKENSQLGLDVGKEDET